MSETLKIYSTKIDSSDKGSLVDITNKLIGYKHEVQAECPQAEDCSFYISCGMVGNKTPLEIEVGCYGKETQNCPTDDKTKTANSVMSFVNGTSPST